MGILSNKKIRFLIGLILGILLIHFIANFKSNIKLNEFALGENNTSGSGRVNKERVHCYYMSDINECIKSYNKQPIKEIILWLGNSQLDAINQYNQGDQTASVNLHIQLKKHKKYLLTISQPNANLQEHYTLISYFLDSLKIDLLILPIVFDDMRENGIRYDLLDVFKSENAIKNLSKSQIGISIIDEHASDNIKNTDNKYSTNKSNSNNKIELSKDLSFSDNSIQEKVEKYLNDQLNTFWFVWTQRADIRGYLFTKLYQFRNWVFNINASSIRNIIPAYYDKNLKSYEAIIDLANKKNIKVLPYIVPIRHDVKIPYDKEEYNKFKNDIFNISKKNNINLINLEKLIPGKYWVTKNSTNLIDKQELDFMHFQSEGHTLLSNKLYSLIISRYID